MTTVVILLIGLGAVLLVSAFESNPDGSDVSVIQAVTDIWNNNLNFSQTKPTGTGPSATVGTGPSATAATGAAMYAMRMQTNGSAQAA